MARSGSSSCTKSPTASSARAASRLVDPRAYELYLRGRNAVAERRFADAVTFFQQATDVDAGLAEAHAGLAEALFMQARFSQTRGMAPRIQTEVEAAFRADPDLPAAHEAAALLESRRSGIAKGLDQLRAAIAADPSDATAYHAVGDLVKLLLPERAISCYRASLALDPHLDASRGDIVRSLLLLRRRDAAAAEAASMASDPVGARIMLAEYDLLETGRDTLPPDTHPEPGALYGVWIRYARALKNVRRDRAAQEMLRIVLRAAPGACEADALSGRRPSPATPPDPLAPTLACGIVAAAASGDAANAAKLLERFADRADSQIDDVSLSGDLTQFDRARSWYPWSRVQADGRVQAAVKQVTEALDRLRRELPAQLPPLPGPG